MPVTLTNEQIVSIWDNDDARRTIQTARREYYDGTQDILDEDSERIDGSDRTRNVINWVKYIVNAHVSFLTCEPFRYSLDAAGAERGEGVSADDQREALANLSAIYDDNNLNAMDVENMTSAVLCLNGVEVHSYDPEGNDGEGKIVINSYDPEDWGFLRDASGNVVAAIYKTTIPAGSYFEEAIVDEDFDLYAVYDDANIRVLKAEGSNLSEVSNTAHQYGRLPVVVYYTGPNDDKPFVSDALVGLQNSYNFVASGNIDALLYNLDGLLKMMGIEQGALYEKDENGVRAIDLIRQNRVLPMPEGGDASFIEKNNNYDAYDFSLTTLRRAIHMMGAVPDKEEIAGATGATSGIALKLKLQPQIEQGSNFFKYFVAGLRQRIDLINAMWEIKSFPMLTNYNIKPDLNIPVNETEIWTSIGALEPYLTLPEMLRRIPGIEDPDATAEAKKAENEENTSLELERIKATQPVDGVADDADLNAGGDDADFE